MRPSIKAFSWLPLLILLASCGGEEHQDIKQWMKEQSKDMRGQVPPLPEIKPFPIVSYEASNLTDPYRPAKIEPAKKVDGAGAGAGPRPDMNRPREELEKYPLESLKMVGTVDLQGKSFAIIQVDGKVYRVTAGNYMGLNYGKITKVTEAEVQMKEWIQDIQGNWDERSSSLQLQEQEGRK